MIKPLSDPTFIEQFAVTGEYSINNSGGHWNSLDDFRAAVHTAEIPEDHINIEAEYNLYMSNPREYRNDFKLPGNVK